MSGKRKAPLQHKPSATQSLILKRRREELADDGTLECFVRLHGIEAKYRAIREVVRRDAAAMLDVESPPFDHIGNNPTPLQQLVAVHHVVAGDAVKRKGTLDALGYRVVALVLERLFGHPRRRGVAIKDKLNSLRKRGLMHRLVSASPTTIICSLPPMFSSPVSRLSSPRCGGSRRGVCADG
jgi:hypothetical protein